MEPVDRYEKVEVDNQGPYRYREEVVADVGEERADIVGRVVNLVWLLIVALEILFVLRITLRLIAANPNNAFAAFVYNVTDIFLLPFLTIAATPGAEGMVLDIPAIIGALVYLLFGWLIVKLLWLLFKPSRRRTVRRVEEVD